MKMHLLQTVGSFHNRATLVGVRMRSFPKAMAFRNYFGIIFIFAFVAVSHSLPSKKAERAEGDKVPFTFNDIYDPAYSYSSFYPSWVSDTEYLFRDEDGIQKMNMSSGTSSVIVSKEVYDKTAAKGWSLSADEKYFLARTSYQKQWRYSYNASYSVYGVSDGDTALLELPEDTQYVRWSPIDSAIVWVRDNDLYYAKTPTSSQQRLTFDGAQNEIYNGVPDWVYEEEMVGTRHVIYWSPDGRFLAYLSTNDTEVNRIEFTVYKGKTYPEMLSVAYPKAGTPNPVVTLHIHDLIVIAGRPNDHIVVAPTADIGMDHLFSTFYWYPDSGAFLVSWLNRISNKCVPQLCQYNETWSCDVVRAGIEESDSGWIGNGGTPFTPKFTGDAYRTYITAFSNDAGYWHVAVVNATANDARYVTTGTSVIASVLGYDADNDYVYFRAAAPLPGSRNVYRVRYSAASPVDVAAWECISCGLDQDRCQWVNPSFSPLLTYAVMNCGGPGVPMTTIQMKQPDGNYNEPQVYENNTVLIENKEKVLWPTRDTKKWMSTTGIEFIYEMFYPENFDNTKKYPLLIEVYGGPGFQKVQNRWTKRWAQTHMVSQYEILVASFDGRGSGYRGDDIAHLLYKRIGQLEKKDTTEVAQYFIHNMDYVDASKIAVWGWSYGGYVTTFTISEGSGVFKCGLAVAPLASRYFYDSIHTERYMTLPDDNVDGYEKCSILNSNLTNFNLASYTIIHGMADDNVHFQNAALISKALVEAEVRFDNFYYADEAHSINTGPNANRHIYKLLTKKIRQCFNLDAPTT